MTADSKVEVHGHRGARARFPENTLSGFRYALDLDIDAIEVDIALSKDLVPVIHHDRSIAKDSNFYSGELIKNLTLKQVKQIELGTRLNPEFPLQKLGRPESIPTLEEFIDLVLSHPNKKTRMNLEIKTHPILFEETLSPESFTEAILQIIQKLKVDPERILFQSFDPRTLIALNEAQLECEKSFLIDEWSDDLVEVAHTLSIESLSPEWKLLNEERIQLLKGSNIKIYTWTANSPKIWEDLARWNVNGIISDDPEALKSFLKNRQLDS